MHILPPVPVDATVSASLLLLRHRSRQAADGVHTRGRRHPVAATSSIDICTMLPWLCPTGGRP